MNELKRRTIAKSSFFFNISLIVAFLISASSGCTAKNGKKDDSSIESESEPPIDPMVLEYLEKGFVEISPSTFTAGSPEDQPCRGMYTEDQVEVTLTYPFEIAATEVTQVVWKATGLPNPSYPEQADELPVNFVNWFDAVYFCNMLSEAAGLETCYDLSSSTCTGEPGTGCPPEDQDPETRGHCTNGVYLCDGRVRKYEHMFNCDGYRLPTAVEWEYAARAGTTTSTYNGDSTFNEECGPSEVLEPIAWYCHNSDGTPHPVAKKRPNKWGLYDVLGNLAEWTDGAFGGASLETYEGKAGPLTNPMGAAENISTSRDTMGEMFISEECSISASYHLGWPFEDRTIAHGLRPVRTLAPPDPDDTGYSGRDTENPSLDTETETEWPWNTEPGIHAPMIPFEGCVFDPETGLCWQVPWAEEKMIWSDAIVYCDNLELAGHDDWYLPDVEELITLIRGCANTEPGGVCEAHVDISLYDWCTDEQLFSCWGKEGPGVNGCFWDTLMGDCNGNETSGAFVASSSEPVPVDTEYETDIGERWGHTVRFFDAIPGASLNAENVMCVRRAVSSKK